MITFWLIVHGILGVFLLGAITHQSVSVCWSSPPKSNSFVSEYRGVRAGVYVDAVIVLYCITALFGALLYPSYRVDVRTFLEQLGMKRTAGLFELKEHFAAIGLGLLPAYWYYWRGKPAGGLQAGAGDGLRTRQVITVFLAAIVWWNFIVGHIINNTRGFGL